MCADRTIMQNWTACACHTLMYRKGICRIEVVLCSTATCRTCRCIASVHFWLRSNCVQVRQHQLAAHCSVLVGALAALVAIIVCFCFSKDLVVFLEAPVATKGVRFLQLSPGEFFFTTFKVPSAGKL